MEYKSFQDLAYNLKTHAEKEKTREGSEPEVGKILEKISRKDDEYLKKYGRSGAVIVDEDTFRKLMEYGMPTKFLRVFCVDGVAVMVDRDNPGRECKLVSLPESRGEKHVL